MKLFHLNIEKGRKYPEVIKYVKRVDPDIICFQELAGGDYHRQGGDYFTELVEDLPLYSGFLSKQNEPVGHPGTYMGIGIFIKKEIKTYSKKEIIMTPNSGRMITSDDPMNMHCGNTALDVVIKVNGKRLSIVTGHFTWENSPYDNSYKIERAGKVLKHLKRLKHDFILTGDFNVKAETKTVSQFSEIGTILTSKMGITNTLNPNLSRHQHLFPKGVDCDHIITSKGVEVSLFELIKEPDLSDHYGLLMEFVVQ
jgi:endonuclease/exonuclease/phosphatase family metal-dependent hydrolase